MRRILNILVIVSLVVISGCANLNPRNNSPIENDGKIDEIRNNQNGVMAEIGKLKQSAEIQNSQLKEVQNGLLNLNTSLSRNENSGVQILQGDGALILVFSIVVIGMLLYWYRDRAVKGENAAEIMAKEIVRLDDPGLNDNVLKEAMHTKSENYVYKMLINQKRSMLKSKV
jgi:hypothetical protein